MRTIQEIIELQKGWVNAKEKNPPIGENLLCCFRSTCRTDPYMYVIPYYFTDAHHLNLDKNELLWWKPFEYPSDFIFENQMDAEIRNKQYEEVRKYLNDTSK